MTERERELVRAVRFLRSTSWDGKKAGITYPVAAALMSLFDALKPYDEEESNVHNTHK